MAAPNTNNQQDLNDQLKQTVNLLEQILDDNRRISDEIKDQIDLAQNLNVISKDQANNINQVSRDVSNLNKKILDNQDDIVNGLRDQSIIEKDLTKARQAQLSLITEQSSIESKLQFALTAGNAQEASALQGILSSLEEKKNITDTIVDAFQQESKLSGQIASNLGFFPELIGKSNGLFGKLGINSNTFATNIKKSFVAQNGMNQATSATGKLLNAAAATSKGLAKTLSSANLSVTSKAAGFLQIVQLAIAANKNVTQLQKSLGISAGNATRLKQEFNANAGATNDTFITSGKLIKSFGQLQNELGVIVSASDEILVTQTNLTERLGFSSSEAAKLSGILRLQGPNTEATMDNLVGSTDALIKSSGVALDVKDVLKEVANTADSVKVSLASNPEAISEAVVAARQLGTTLSNIDNIAGSLLDFESSISAELEAELLTGKQINLERARAAALANDFEGLTEEIGKNQEIINAFSSGNRIEQEAIAKSLGMSRDELSKMVLQQQFNQLGAEKFRDTYGEANYENMKALDVQEKFNAAIMKLKEGLVDVFDALSPIVSAFSMIFDIVGFIFAPLAAITNWANGISPILGGVVGLLIALGAAALFFNGALTLGIGIAIALAAIGGGMALLKSETEPRPVQLATGGIVMPKPGGTPAIIGEGGEPEAVVPLSKANQMGFSGERSSQPIVIQNTFSNFQSSGPYALSETQRRQASPTFA
jgi:uncharacterized membrane protein